MEYSFCGIAIKSSFSFSIVYKIRLLARVNEHVKLELWAGLKQEDANDVVMQEHVGESIIITLQKKQNYFTGIISNVEIQVNNGLFSIHLSCISASALLDIYPRNRSYQNTNETYADMLKNSYRKENHADIACCNIADTPLHKPVIQYGETTWAFTLRMAGKLSTYVIADNDSLYPKVLLGNCELPLSELEAVEYTKGYCEANGFYYRCQSSKQLRLGSQVILHNHKWLVVEKESVFVNGEFINTYTLGTAAGYAVKPHELPLSGRRLKGTVLAVQGERLKLHLDIDTKQDLAGAFWFDFVPQSGNVMYSMPKVGETAMLRFCSDQGDSAVVEECWREDSRTCADLAEYHNRYFTTEFEKRMAMLPETLFFNSGSNKAELSDSIGIQLKTNRYTNILAEQGLVVKAGKRIQCKTPHHIYITKPGTKSVIDLAMNKINIESSNTNIVTRPERCLQKAGSVYVPKPMVSIRRNIALSVLAFIPSRSGKRVL